MCEVLVHAPGFALCACDGDLLLGGVVKEVIAAGKALVEFGDTPGSDDFNCGLEGVKGEFEADLVVALIQQVSKLSVVSRRTVGAFYYLCLQPCETRVQDVF